MDQLMMLSVYHVTVVVFVNSADLLCSELLDLKTSLKNCDEAFYCRLIINHQIS